MHNKLGKISIINDRQSSITIIIIDKHHANSICKISTYNTTKI